MMALLYDILLGQYGVALETAAFALARNLADPFQRQCFGFGKLARILDVVPHAIDDFPQLPLDRFGVVHRI